MEALWQFAFNGSPESAGSIPALSTMWCKLNLDHSIQQQLNVFVPEPSCSRLTEDCDKRGKTRTWVSRLRVRHNDTG